MPNHVRIRSATAFVLDLVPYHVNKPERRVRKIIVILGADLVICLGENLFFCASLCFLKNFYFLNKKKTKV